MMIKKDGKQMKMNNKLFLIAVTLGLMAAGSATAFAASHTNYVYVVNNTSQGITASESWISSHDYMYFSNGVGGSKSVEAVLVEPYTERVLTQSVDNHYDQGHTRTVTAYGEVSISNHAKVEFKYHAFWGDAHGGGSELISWNRLDNGTILSDPNGNTTLENTNGECTNKVGAVLDCTDDTHMTITITNGGDNPSLTSSPLGLLKKLF